MQPTSTQPPRDFLPDSGTSLAVPGAAARKRAAASLLADGDAADAAAAAADDNADDDDNEFLDITSKEHVV